MGAIQDTVSYAECWCFVSSTYVPSLKAVLELTDPSAYFNDIPVNFGPVLFDIMNGMYDKVGSMEFGIGLSMRTPDAWSKIVELALAAEAKLGDRLDVMLLGNVGLHSCCPWGLAWFIQCRQEPDLYAGHGERDAYEISDYVHSCLSVLLVRIDHPTRFLKSATFWVIYMMQALWTILLWGGLLFAANGVEPHGRWPER